MGVSKPVFRVVAERYIAQMIMDRVLDDVPGGEETLTFHPKKYQLLKNVLKKLGPFETLQDVL